jgi:hypothetical protein
MILPDKAVTIAQGSIERRLGEPPIAAVCLLTSSSDIFKDLIDGMACIEISDALGATRLKPFLPLDRWGCSNVYRSCAGTAKVFGIRFSGTAKELFFLL